MSSDVTLGGQLFLDGVFVPGRLRLAGGAIAEVETLAGAGADDERLLVPGLIDLHVHGYGGHDPLENLDGMARALALAGTTAFSPTLFPKPFAELRSDIGKVRAATAASAGGAVVLGAHLEGPFLNPGAAGALPREAFAEPSPAALDSVIGSGDGIATVTVAPELSGARELLVELTRRGVRPSLGHSLATAQEARAAAAGGAVGATHLFNAMRPWHHREVGLAGFALTDGALHAEIIGDGAHVSPEAIELALEARGPAGLCLVSDALSGAGTGCEVFHVGAHRQLVRRGTAFYDDDGGEPSEYSLAGSACSQLEMVRGLVQAGTVSLEEALTMAAETPAAALGREDLGRLAEGARADVLVLDRATLAVQEVYVGGRRIPGPQAS